MFHVASQMASRRGSALTAWSRWRHWTLPTGQAMPALRGPSVAVLGTSTTPTAGGEADEI